MSKAIFVVGSANLDFVVRAPRIPAPGETVLGEDFATFPGGKGANQAVACARAGGAQTRMLLGLGADDFAKPLERSLRDAQVDLHIVRSGHATGTAFICVSASGENAITVAPGANQELRAEHLPSLDGIGWLLLQLETPLDSVTAFAQRARDAGVHVALNAAPAHALPQALLDAIDLLIVNEGELAAIVGAQGSIEDKLSRIDVPSVVVTLGAQGCMARHAGHHIDQPAFAVQVTDTTAAGDTFCGVLVAALNRDVAMPAALREASAAAAIACTRQGAQSSIPNVDEVVRFLDKPPR